MNPSPRRSWLIVGGIAAVAAVTAGVLTVVTGSSGSRPAGLTSPSGIAVQSGGAAGDLVKTVKGYYAAVRAGDASKALSYGTAVADERLLTDAALRAQQAIGRIQQVTVDPDVVVLADHALVDVTITVGGKDYDDLVRVPKAKGRFAFPVAAELSGEDSPYDLLGQTIPAKTTAFVFPGALRTTMKNPYVTVTGGTDVVAGTGRASAFLDREFTLNAAGRTAIRSAVQRTMATCAASRTLRPADTDCPNSTVSVTGVEVPNSARWTAPTDYSPLRIDDDLVLGLDRISVTGNLQFRVTYRARAGSSARTVRENVTASLFGNVDLTTTPPTYTG